MSLPGAPRRAWSWRRLILPTAVAALLLAMIPVVAGAPVHAAPAPLSGHHLTVHPAAVKHPSSSVTLPSISSPRLAPHPLAGSTGSFYQNTSSFATPSKCAVIQPYSYFQYCFRYSTEPSAMLLANGSVGVAYSMIGNFSFASKKCYNSTNPNIAVLGFSVSKDNGTTFGPRTMLGNKSCPYFESLEPSFSVSSTGQIFGAFIEANATFNQLQGGMPYSYYRAPVGWYASDRYADALGFLTSKDNGTTWPNATTISVAGLGGNLSRPALATFGNTVYIAYENLSNNSATLPGANWQTSCYGCPASTGVSVDLVYSKDAGATWHGPYLLPGSNSTNLWTASSPSIAVSRTGTVTVVYDTNRHCIAACSAAAPVMGDDIAFASSTTNGSSWTATGFVAKDTANGETNWYANFQFPGQFEAAPTTAVTYNSTGALFVVWAGGENTSASNCYLFYCYPPLYAFTQAFSAVSTNGGTTWANHSLSPPVSQSMNTYSMGYYNPGIAVSPSGTVYATYSFHNESNSGGCGGAGGQSYFSYGYSQWITTSPDGLHWAPAVVSGIAYNAYNYDGYAGWKSAIAFSTGGAPVVAYALPGDETFVFGTPYVYTYPVGMEVAIPWAGGTVNVTAHENGLPLSSTWAFSVDGFVFSGSTGSSIIVTNVPKGTPVIIQGPQGGIVVGFWATEYARESGPSVTSLFANASYWFNYTLYYGVSFVPDPLNQNYFEVDIFNYTAVPSYSCYAYWDDYLGIPSNYFHGEYPSFPWYFAAGTFLHMVHNPPYPSGAGYYSSNAVGYWNGTGNGNFTGPGPVANITVNGPINETIWAQSFGVYGVHVAALGLPSGSVFNFTWDASTSYAAAAPTSVTVPSQGSGPHWISNIWANSSTAGWEYFGFSEQGNPVILPEEPNVNLSFAFVDVAAPVGTISFHAVGLTQGTPWHFKFNGTELSSSTPWINVTSHNGTYPVAAFPVVSANGSAGYAPTGVTATMSVSTGNVYDVNYLPAYSLSVIAGSGGSVSPASGTYWVTPGTIKSFTASAGTGYNFIGWTGTGVGSSTVTTKNVTVTVNGPVVETANFAPYNPARFNLTITQGSIPNGTWWTVQLGGKGYSSNSDTLVIPNLYTTTYSGPLGRYSLGVPYAYENGSTLTRYVPGSYPSEVNVVPGLQLHLSFATQYFVTLGATPGGNVSAAVGVTSTSSSFWIASTQTFSAQATPDLNYEFLGWNGTGSGSYTGSLLNPVTVAPSGPVSEIAVFGLIPHPLPPRYWVTFTLTTPFVSGTVWAVVFNGQTYTSTTNSLTVYNLLANPSPGYTVAVLTATSPDGLTQYQPAGAPTVEKVAGNVSASLSYRTWYFVSISSVGPGVATITAPGGGAPTTKGGFYAAGTPATLNATASGTNLFVGWTGTGSGSFSGASPQQSIAVNAPITEVATFVPPAPPTIVVNSVWSSTGVIAGLAIAGLVVGLVVGVVVMRMRGRSPPPVAASTPVGEPMEQSPPEGGAA